MRIRSIKPEFWRSDDISALDWPTRLLFIGLWSYVDDNGVGVDRSSHVAADLFAADLEMDPRETLATVSRGLQTLSDAGLITRYTVARKPYLHVSTWEQHQRIDRPNKQRYPLPTCEDAEFATPSRDTREDSATGAGEQRNRGTEEKGKNPIAHSRSETKAKPNRFDEFWDAYDHKRDRKKAEKAYVAAIKKPGVTEDLVISAAGQYVAWQKSEGKHPQFTKHPTTWLHGECWNDERAARSEPRGRVAEHMDLVQRLAAREEAEANGNVVNLSQIGTRP